MKLIDYLTYRAWHEGVAMELEDDNNFLTLQLSQGKRIFFGITTDEKGNPLSD